MSVIDYDIEQANKKITSLSKELKLLRAELDALKSESEVRGLKSELELTGLKSELADLRKAVLKAILEDKKNDMQNSD